MTDKILKSITFRTKYLSILTEDLKKNETQQEKEQDKINKLEEIKNTVSHLTQRPEWPTLIQLSKRVYVPGKIKHTGEYMVEIKAQPSSYRTLMTAKQTIDILNKKTLEHRNIVMLLENQKTQLIERTHLLTGRKFDDDEIEDNDMPEEILSDKGVAVKVGGFYEIIEYES